MAWWTQKKLHPKTKSRFVIVFGSNFFIPSVKSVGKPKIDFDTKEFKLLNHKFNYPGNGTWQPIDIKFVDMNGLGSRDETFDTSAFLWQILNNTGYAYPYLDDGSNVSNNPYYNVVTDEKLVSSGGHHIATGITTRNGSSYRTITTPEKSSTIANSFGKGLSGQIDNTRAHYAKQKISIYQLSPESPTDKGKEEIPKGATISECWHLVNPIVKSIAWGDLSYDSEDLVEYTLNVIYDWAIYDRSQIGKPFSTDAEPYQNFGKKYGLASKANDEEQRMQVQENIREEFDNIPDVPDFDSYDINNDGVIDEEEAQRAIAQSNLLEEAYFKKEGDTVLVNTDGERGFEGDEITFSLENQEEVKQKFDEIQELREKAEDRIQRIETTEAAEEAKQKLEQRAEAKRTAQEREEAVDSAIIGDAEIGGTPGIFEGVEDGQEFGREEAITRAEADAEYVAGGEFEPETLQPEEQAGSGGLSASGGGLEGGGTVDSFGDVFGQDEELTTTGRDQITDDIMSRLMMNDEAQEALGDDFNNAGEAPANRASSEGLGDNPSDGPNLDYENDQTFIIIDRPTNREDDPDWEPLEEGPSYQESSNVLDPGYNMPTDPREDPRYRPEERDPQLEIVPAPRAAREDTEIDPADQDDTLDD